MFGVDFIGGEAVFLELTQIVEGLGGTALLAGGHSEGAFHLREGVGVGGIGEPAVLGKFLEAASAGALKGSPSVALEGFFFEVGVGLAVAAELEGLGFKGRLFVGVGGEERSGESVEAVAEGIGGGAGFATGGAGACSELGVGAVGEDLLFCGHRVGAGGACVGSKVERHYPADGAVSIGFGKSNLPRPLTGRFFWRNCLARQAALARIT